MGVTGRRSDEETVSTVSRLALAATSHYSSAHVFTFLLPRMATCGLGHAGAQAPPDQARRCKSLSIPAPVRIRERHLHENQLERYGLKWHKEDETVENGLIRSGPLDHPAEAGC